MLHFIASLMLAPQLAAAAMPWPAQAQVHARAQSCAAALASTSIEGLPEPVETIELREPAALLSLRARRGDSLIVVRGGVFNRANFRGAHLHNICFERTHFFRSDWRGARAPGAGFIHARLTGADLRGARMARVLFDSAYLDGVDASGADLSGGSLSGNAFGSLENLRLDRANLSRFAFHCGITEDDRCSHDKSISFRGADLTRAAVDTYWGEADWTGARFDRTVIGLDQLDGLRSVRLAGPLVLRWGGSRLSISPAEYRVILPHVRHSTEASAPSFDCGRARAPIEVRICAPGSGLLRRMDLEVDRLYRRARASDLATRAAQRAWLRDRDHCGAECLYQSYDRRRAALIDQLARMGLPDWARRERAALFIEPAVEFDEAFQSTALFRRLLPVIVASASSLVVVRVNADGTVNAVGDAIGGNAHHCGLDAQGLRLDRRTGWYSGPYVRHDNEPEGWARRPMPVLRFWADRAEVYRQGHSYRNAEEPRISDYVLCGARAGFAELIRLPVPAAQIPRLAAAWPWA